jgi:hypothetical protein
MNTHSSKIDQIWNTNFNSSLRANVGVIDVERQVADLMAVPLLNQQETHNKGTVSYSVKTAINLELFWRNECTIQPF